MKRVVQILILLLCLLASFPVKVWAQEQRNFDRQKWEELVEGVEYVEEKEAKVPPETPSEEEEEESNSEELVEFLIKGFAIIALLVILGFLIKAILDANRSPKNKKLKAQILSYSSAEEVEEKLMETDLEKLLEQAIQNEQYLWAIRLYYLTILKTLTERNFLQWSRDKTNRDYLRELGKSGLSEEFQYVTQSFDRLWYGMVPVDKPTFEETAPNFSRFLDRVRSEKVQSPQLT